MGEKLTVVVDNKGNISDILSWIRDCQIILGLQEALDTTTIGDETTIEVPNQETKDELIELLAQFGVTIISEIADSRQDYLETQPPFPSPTFTDGVSSLGFIGNFPNLEALRKHDQEVLTRIGGSFEEIADRMKWFLDWVDELIELEQIATGAEKNGFRLVNCLLTRGHQECPFQGCTEYWNDEVTIENTHTGKRITINRGTEHLAREHHLLEKDNQYECLPGVFYEHFMV